MAAETPHVPTLASEVIGYVGTFGIRNTLLMAWLAMGVLLLFAIAARMTGYKMIPGRFQTFVEVIVEGLHDFFNSIFQDEKKTRRFLPIVATMFLFIMIANWMGIFPGVGTILIQGEHEGRAVMLPLFRSMNADVNMTLAFALVAFVLVQVVGIASLGLFHHVGKYVVAPWKKPYGVGTLVGILEFIGEFARAISFTFRLFGNIFAGEVLLVVISFLVPYLLPVPFLGLEIFVGFIQALVFSMLTAVFLVMASTPHGEHETAH